MSSAVPSPTPFDPSLRARLARLVETRPLARYGVAAALVAACLGLRLLLGTAFTAGYGYTCFYPAVILAAYRLGAGPGVFAAGLSAVLVSAFLNLHPFRFDPHGWVILGFFLASSAIAIYVLSEIRGQLNRLSHSHAAAEALAASQAELFREHAERVTNHLQLIAAILQLQARGEDDAQVSRVLTNAASRTLLISRMHREFTSAADRRIDFEAFAQRLAAAAAAAGPHTARQIRIAGHGVGLPLEHATSLGLILLDALGAGEAAAGPGSAPPLEVDLSDRPGGQRELVIAARGPAATVARDTLMLQALAEQMRGRLLISRTEAGAELRLMFPAELQPPPAFEPLSQAFH